MDSRTQLLCLLHEWRHGRADLSGAYMAVLRSGGGSGNATGGGGDIGGGAIEFVAMGVRGVLFVMALREGEDPSGAAARYLVSDVAAAAYVPSRGLFARTATALQLVTAYLEQGGGGAAPREPRVHMPLRLYECRCVVPPARADAGGGALRVVARDEAPLIARWYRAFTADIDGVAASEAAAAEFGRHVSWCP